MAGVVGGADITGVAVTDEVSHVLPISMGETAPSSVAPKRVPRDGYFVYAVTSAPGEARTDNLCVLPCTTLHLSVGADFIRPPKPSPKGEGVSRSVTDEVPPVGADFIRPRTRFHLWVLAGVLGNTFPAPPYRKAGT